MRPHLHRSAPVAALLGLLACGDAAEPTSSAIPPLEAVDFDALGPGAILFSRHNAGDYLIAGGPRTVTTLPLTDRRMIVPRLAPGADHVTALAVGGTPGTVYDVFVWDTDSWTSRRITDFEGNAEGPPSWTAAGDGIVFFVSPLNHAEPRGIHVWSLASGTVSRVRTFVPDSNGAFTCPSVSGGPLVVGTVAVSPTGATAYACYGALVVADGLHMEGTVRHDPGDSGTVHGVAWSPDGLEVAFVEVQRDFASATERTVVRVLRAADGTMRTLASLPYVPTVSPVAVPNRHDLCWTGDGMRIAFAGIGDPAPGSGHEVAHIYLINPDGSGLVQLTTAPGVFDYSLSCAGPPP